jgi:hypothetical protein
MSPVAPAIAPPAGMSPRKLAPQPPAPPRPAEPDSTGAGPADGNDNHFQLPGAPLTQYPRAQPAPGRTPPAGQAIPTADQRAVAAPSIIAATGRFSPSPAPYPSTEGQSPPLPEDDFDDDWDPQPPAHPADRRAVTLRRRGQAAGSLTRAQAARLEEELRRRFGDHNPGGAP